MNLDTILEEVLQQLVIPGLRSSIVDLCIAEQEKYTELNKTEQLAEFHSTAIRLDEIEQLLISRLPKHLQANLKSCTSKNNDIFTTTLKELDGFLHVKITSNQIESKGTSSPLEEINCLDNVIRSVMNEVSYS